MTVKIFRAPPFNASLCRYYVGSIQIRSTDEANCGWWNLPHVYVLGNLSTLRHILLANIQAMSHGILWHSSVGIKRVLISNYYGDLVAVLWSARHMLKELTSQE